MTNSFATFFNQLVYISRAAFDDVRIPSAYYALPTADQYTREPDELA